MSQEKKKSASHKKDPVLEWVFQASQVLAFGMLFIFLMANILYSQKMPEVYFALAKHQEGSFIEFVQKARRIDAFWELFPQIKDLMVTHADAIFADTTSRRGQIDVLKKALEANPQSPEILYSLHLLYQSEGQEGLSQEYLQKARDLDPMIGEE